MQSIPLCQIVMGRSSRLPRRVQRRAAPERAVDGAATAFRVFVFPELGSGMYYTATLPLVKAL